MSTLPKDDGYGGRKNWWALYTSEEGTWPLETFGRWNASERGGASYTWLCDEMVGAPNHDTSTQWITNRCLFAD